MSTCSTGDENFQIGHLHHIQPKCQRCTQEISESERQPLYYESYISKTVNMLILLV